MISGRTRIIAHIGVPTESFTAPMIYNPWFEAKGIDTVVVPMGCEAPHFPDFVRLVFCLRNIAGALITMPHKVTTAGLLDVASTTVRVCGACNAVRRDGDDKLAGDMFDGEGFVRGVRRKGREIAGLSALVFGAGGVGSAIAASLAKAGLAHLCLFDTDEACAERLATSLRMHYPSLAVTTGSCEPGGHQIVVNASPLGTKAGDPLPFDVSRIDRDAFVGDVVLKQAETPLLSEARKRGCMTQPGIDMLFEQIPACLEFFGFPSTTPEELRDLATIVY